MHTDSNYTKSNEVRRTDSEVFDPKQCAALHLISCIAKYCDYPIPIRLMQVAFCLRQLSI